MSPAAETEGQVVKRFKDAGQTVRAGDPLFELANDPLQAALAEAEADLALRRFNHDGSLRLRATDTVSEQDLRNKAFELAPWRPGPGPATASCRPSRWPSRRRRTAMRALHPAAIGCGGRPCWRGCFPPTSANARPVAVA